MSHIYNMRLTEKDYHRLCKSMVVLRNTLRKLIRDYERPGNDLERTHGSEVVLMKIREARDLEDFTETYTQLISAE